MGSVQAQLTEPVVPQKTQFQLGQFVNVKCFNCITRDVKNVLT